MRTCASWLTGPQWLLISMPDRAADAEPDPLSQ